MDMLLLLCALHFVGVLLLLLLRVPRSLLLRLLLGPTSQLLRTNSSPIRTERGRGRALGRGKTRTLRRDCVVIGAFANSAIFSATLRCHAPGRWRLRNQRRRSPKAQYSRRAP